METRGTYCWRTDANCRGFFLSSSPRGPEAWLLVPDAPEAKICKDRPKIKAAIRDGVFVKRYNHPGGWNQFRTLFRTPRPFKALKAACALEKCGVPTPRVLAAFRNGSVFRHQDYLVTEALPEDAPPGDRVLPQQELARHAEAFAAQLLVPVVKLHEAGLCHGDLSLRNFFRLADGTWGLLDLDGCRKFRHGLPVAVRRRELARLISSFRLAAGEEVPGLSRMWSDRYQAMTGFSLAGPALERRVARLVHRYVC